MASWFSPSFSTFSPPTKNLAFGGTVEARDHVDQRGLAAARLADNGDEFARVDVQVNAFQCHEESGVGFVGFGDGVEVNERG